MTAVYVGQHYEVKNSIVMKYYFAGTTRLAVRTDGTLRFLLGDHLGSSSVTTNASGVKTATALYKAFGETRYALGNLNTDYHFTGQREEASLGIYFFNARWYDGSLGRFLSPDTIVPTSTQGTQAWDRYAFVNNNPVRYTDPTGHCIGGQGFTTLFCYVATSALAEGANNVIHVALGYLTTGKVETPLDVAFVEGAIRGGVKAALTPIPVIQNTTVGVTTTTDVISQYSTDSEISGFISIGPPITVGGKIDDFEWATELKINVKAPSTYRDVVNTTTISATTTTYNQFGEPMETSTSQLASWSWESIEYLGENGQWSPYDPWTFPDDEHDPPVGY